MSKEDSILEAYSEQAGNVVISMKAGTPEDHPIALHMHFRQHIASRCTASDADNFERLVWAHMLTMDEALSKYVDSGG